MFFHRKKRKGATGAPQQEETVIFEDEPLVAPEDEQPAAQQDAEDAADTDAGGDAAEVEEELLELEFDEDDIQCYLVDEDDNEIGFVLLDEDGNEVEYYYAEEDEEADGGADANAPAPAKKATPKNTSLAYRAGAAAASAAHAGKHAADVGVEKAKQGVEKARSWADKFDPNDGEEYDLGITREGVKETTQDMNAIYREGIETITELKDAFDDIKDGLDLGGLFGKKKR